MMFVRVTLLIYCSQKQLPRKIRKIKSRLVIIKCAGYIFWQFFCGDYTNILSE